MQNPVAFGIGQHYEIWVVGIVVGIAVPLQLPRGEGDQAGHLRRLLAGVCHV